MGKKQKRKWNDLRDEFLIAWFAALMVVSLVVGFNKPGLTIGFSAGLSAGLALEKFFRRKHDRLIMKFRLQDGIDLRTTADIVAKMTYRTLHEIDNARLN